jgi:hypothetical protein
MTNRMIALTVVALCAAASASAVAGETFRCGNKLIEPGMTRAQVLQYCGEPTSRTEEEQDVRSGPQVVGKTTLYRWTYDSYSQKRVLVFDQDTLKSISGQ